METEDCRHLKWIQVNTVSSAEYIFKSNKSRLIATDRPNLDARTRGYVRKAERLCNCATNTHTGTNPHT